MTFLSFAYEASYFICRLGLQVPDAFCGIQTVRGMG